MVAVVIPLFYYGHLYRTARRLWLMPTPFRHPEAGRFWTTMRRLFLGSLVGEIVVSFALAMLTCWVLQIRRTMRNRNIGVLVMTDVGLLLAFLLAPWLVPAVGYLRLPQGNPVDGWVLGSLWPNVLPCLAAACAGVTFFLWSRHHERLPKVA